MLIIEVKDSESIDRALKKYKRKVDKTGMIKELRRRKHFTKPSIDRRAEVLRAEYRLKKYGSQ
jgi:small subunit ribosomal protein S21